MHYHFHNQRREIGFALLEVLIALGLFSVLLMGSAKVLLLQESAGREISYHDQANRLADELLQRAMLERPSINIDEWLAKRQHLMPEFDACLSYQGRQITASVVWEGRYAFEHQSAIPCGGTGQSNRRWVTLRSVIPYST